MCCFPAAEGIFSNFQLRSSKGAVGTLRRMSGSRSRSMAVLGAFNVAELARRNKGLFSASPRRVGETWKTPQMFVLFCFH